MRQRLDDGRELVVERGDVAQRAGVRGVHVEGVQAGAQRAVDGHAHVVDGGLGLLVEGLVDADGVGQADGREGREVRDDGVGDAGDVAGVALEDLVFG